MRHKNKIFLISSAALFVFAGLVISHAAVIEITPYFNSIIGDLIILAGIFIMISWAGKLEIINTLQTHKKLIYLGWTTFFLIFFLLLVSFLFPKGIFESILYEDYGMDLPVEFFGLTMILFLGILLFSMVIMQLYGLILIKRKKRTKLLFFLFLASLAIFMVLSSIEKENFLVKGFTTPEGALSNLVYVSGFLVMFMIVINSYRNSWVNYLNKQQKITGLFFGVLLLIFSLIVDYSPGIQLPELTVDFSITAISFLVFSKMFLYVYFIMAILSLLLHLPTAGIFDKKVQQLASLNQLTNAVATTLQFEKLLNLITEQALHVVYADSAWLLTENKKDKKYNLASYIQLTSMQLRMIKEDQYSQIINDILEAEDTIILNELNREMKISYPLDSQKIGGSLICVPLNTPTKGILGILFAWKKMEYGFDQEDRKMLEAFANQAVFAVNNSYFLEESLERERLQQELKIARDMQLKLLPKQIPDISKNYRIEAVSKPAYEVGGDYYDFIKLNDHQWGIFIGDVSGKGTSAAFYMAEIKGFIQSFATIYHSPKKLLEKVNETLYSNIDRQSFISLLAAVIDVKKNKLTFTRAGHSPLGYCDPATNKWEFLKPDGMGLGLDKGEIFNNVIEEKTIKLSDGCTVFIYTDGVTEVFNEEGEEFGDQRLKQLLEECRNNGIRDYSKKILEEVNKFSSNKLNDDITMIIIHSEKKHK
ncbi:GAF domain-containing SpoIIE family protein phosphatase [candidate division KSB1 bacterium]